MTVSTVKAKVCLVGDKAVGKTSLVRRFVLDEFSDEYLNTIGAKTTKHEIPLSEAGGEVLLQMTIWDIMGETSFRELLREAYFSGARGILAVCDITRPETLSNLEAWVREVIGFAGPVPVVLLGNKADLSAEALVRDLDLLAFAERHRAPWTFTSAKTGQGVEWSFRQLAMLVAGNRDAEGNAPSATVAASRGRSP